MRFQLDNLCSYPPEIRQRITLLVIDDGSQRAPALPVVEQRHRDQLDVSLYRIDTDIPWNMAEANNLAFREAKTECVIRTDIDHSLDTHDMRSLLYVLDRRPPKGVYYKFKRKTRDGERLRSHINSYVIHRDDYWDAGGYNEYFSGTYGKEDSDFLNRLQISCRTLDIPLTVSSSFSTRDLDRDQRRCNEKINNKNRPHLTFVHKESYVKQ